MLTDAEKLARKPKRRTPRVATKVPTTVVAKKGKAASKTALGPATYRVTKVYGVKKVPNRGVAQVFIKYDAAEGVLRFVEKVRRATPMQLVDVERRGVDGRLLKDIAREMDIPTSRFFSIIGVPKATAEKKASDNAVIAGAGGQAALGIVKLLAIARSIVDSSTADEARDFDAAKWLGQWIERPQPALGGKKPAEILDTPTGIEIVARVLGAIESGAYL